VGWGWGCGNISYIWGCCGVGQESQMVPKLTRDQGDLDKVSGQWGRQTVMGVTCHIQVATSCPPMLHSLLWTSEKPVRA
jgi:hypothetical protein